MTRWHKNKSPDLEEISAQEQSVKKLWVDLKKYFGKKAVNTLVIDRHALVALEKQDLAAYDDGRETPNATDHLFELVGYGEEAEPLYQTLLMMLSQEAFRTAVTKTPYQDIRWAEFFPDTAQQKAVRELIRDESAYESFRKVSGNENLNRAFLSSLIPQRIHIINCGMN